MGTHTHTHKHTPKRKRTRMALAVFDDFFRHPLAQFNNFESEGMRVPRCDLSETDKSYAVTAELPGLKPDQVNITLHNRVLSISGEVNEEHEEGKPGEKRHLK